LLKIY